MRFLNQLYRNSPYYQNEHMKYIFDTLRIIRKDAVGCNFVYCVLGCGRQEQVSLLKLEIH